MKKRGKTSKKLEFIKDVLDIIVKAGSLIVAFVVGYFAIFAIIDNFIRSLLYNIDFSLFKINLDIYIILILFIFVGICFFFLSSLISIVKCIFHTSTYKDVSGRSFKFNLIYLISIALPLFILFWGKWKTLLLAFMIIGFTGGIGYIMIFLVKEDSDNNIDNKPSSLTVFLSNSLKEISFVFIVVFLIFLSCRFYSFLHEKTYYYLEVSDSSYEVVIETYSDYYITKKVRIENNNLIILWNTQNIRSTDNTNAVKRTFDNIMIENDKIDIS